MQLKYKYLYIVSVLLLLTGAALALTEHLLFDILYTLGAVGYGLYYVLAPERDASPLLRRVARMGVCSSCSQLQHALASSMASGVVRGWSSLRWACSI